MLTLLTLKRKLCCAKIRYAIMKHIFIVNPAAGPRSSVDELKAKLEELKLLDKVEIYVTGHPNDATEYVASRLEAEPNETLRFYACGGDGTLHEVASGAVGHENAEITCYPSGSGNDYIKCFDLEKDAFLDIKALMDAPTEPVDMVTICGKHSINVCNFGFESIVAETMAKVRRKKLIGGKNAYTTGIVKAIFTGMRNKCKVYADGELLNPKGTMLLCTVANGQYVGGAYKCAPRSLNNDGWLEVCFVKPISIFRFLSLINDYKNGTHLVPKYEKIITYRRAKKVDVETGDGKIAICIDGEVERADNCAVEIVPRSVKFAAPIKVPAKI